ncbi:hypothetical protein MUK42_24432 [Musa troglodytarum]|uniref:Uncharacterized protein n=1 Tax=Musa troglodytarum TaxID=320322 RepID=A0A9E7KAG9_9LILI|nr:hypothetical protein MUK42_24432 [Musa troglodytarum]
MELEYNSMTRRELQALCKQHGLPANLTNSRMAENLASLLQKRNSEEMKLKGCLKGSNGSSGEGAGRGGVNKKVSFHMQEDDGERDGSQRDLEARTSPERRRPSRRRSFVVSASNAASEPVLEANGAFEVKTRSKRLRSTAAAVVWSPVIEEEAQNRNNGPDLAAKVPHEEENNRREVACAPTTRSPSRVVTVTEVKTRSTRRRSTAAAVVRSHVIEEEAQNRNNGPHLAAKVPHQEENTRRKVDKEDDHCAPTARSLRNRVVTIGGDEAMQGDTKLRRMQTRGNAKRKEEDVVAPVFDVSSEAQVLEKDENFGSKAHPKRTRSDISTVGLDDQQEIMVPHTEVPPPRRSKRNLAKSHNLFQGSEESGPTSVVSIPHVQNYEKPAGEETKGTEKLRGALNRPRRHTSRIKDEDFGASLPGSLESRDEHPNKVVQKKERKAIRNPDLAVPLPDVILTESAEDHARKEKLSKVEEPRRRCTRSSSVLIVLEHETSLAHDVEPVRKNKTTRHERNMKTSKGATEITVPGCETEAALQELIVQVDPKRVAQTKDTLRRSMRNVPKFASTEFKTSSPLVSSSIIDEHKKENKLSNNNAPELQITGNTLVDVVEKARRSQRLKKGQVLVEAPTEDSTTDCTVRGENELLEGHRHVEESRRKSTYNASRRELVMPINEAVKNTRQKKRKRAVVSDKEFSIEEVEIAGSLDTVRMQQNAGSNQHKERLCENFCEKVFDTDDAVRGNYSTELAVILTDEMANFDAYHTAVKKIASRKRHSNETHEECSEHQIKEDKNFPSMVVEPVAFGLLDTQRTTDNTDGSQESAPAFTSESSVAAKHVVSETAGSNHSKVKSASKVQHSPLIDDLTNGECHADQLIESRNLSWVKTLQGFDNLTLMVKEDREISSYNLVEVFSRSQDGFSYVDPSVKADSEVPGAECGGFADMPSMNSTMDGANYTEERDGPPKGTNVVDSPLPCSHLEEPSPAVATEASTVSDHGVAASHIPICPSGLKDGVLLPLIVVPDNDFVGLLNQQNIIKNESGNIGATSVALLDTESACQEFNGLIELKGTNIYSNNPKMCEPAEEGKYESSSSHLLINTSTIGTESVGDKCEEEYFDGNTSPSEIAQGAEIVVLDEGNQNSSFRATDGSPGKSVTKYDSLEQVAGHRELSPHKLMELSGDIMETLLEVNDVSRLSSGDNLCQNYEKVITFHDDNSEICCSDDANLVCAISASLSEIPVETIADASVQMEGVEVSSQGNLRAYDKSTTLLLVGSEYEKQLEVQEDKFQVEFSASSIRSGKNGSAAKAPPRSDGSENNDRTEKVGTICGAGATLQFKEESESAKLEDTHDARASSDESNDHSPVNPIKSEGTGSMDSSSMYKKSNKGKTFSASSRKMKNTHIESHINVLTGSKEDHIANGSPPASGNRSEGEANAHQLSNLEVSESEAETWVDSANMKSPYSVPEEFKVVDKLEERQCLVLSGGRNSCIGEDEFQALTKANSIEPADDEEDVSNRRPPPLSILKESDVMNDSDIIIPSKSANSAVIERPILELQTPVLAESKDDDVQRDGVKNGGLDASCGLSCSGYEHAKSLCTESAAPTNKFDGEPIDNIGEALDLCGKFQASSDNGETTWGTPDGQGSAGRWEIIVPFGRTSSSVKYESTELEEKILPLEHYQSSTTSCINEELAPHSDNVKKHNMRDTSKVSADDEEHEAKDLQERMEMEEVDEQEYLVTLDKEIDEHATSSGSIASRDNLNDEKHSVPVLMDSFESTASCHAVHSCEITRMADQHEADACCVTPRFENDSASNCDHKTKGEILASRTLVIAETKLVKPEYNLDSCNSTISEVTQEASTPEIAQEAVDTVGPKVGDVSLTPQHSECAEETIKDDMNFGFKKLDCEDDEFDDTKGCDTDSNGVLETKNDEVLWQHLDSKDPKDERSECSDALQVKLDLERSEEADMEICDTESGSNFSHTVHKHDEGKDNIFASEISDDCSCKLGSLKKDANVNQRIKSEEVWVAPGATLTCLEDLFDMEQKRSFVRNDIVQAVANEHISHEENFQHEHDSLVGISGALRKAQKMERVSFVLDENVTNEYEEKATLCDAPKVNFDATIEYDNTIQLELSYDRSDSKLMNVAKEHQEQAVITAWSDGFRINIDETTEPENAVQPEVSTDFSDLEPMDGMVCPASMQSFEERLSKESGAAVEDEDGRSAECLQTVSEKHPASQQNDEDLEISDTVGCQNSSDGYIDESESNVAAEAWFEDLTTGKLVSNPGASVSEDGNTTCQMETTDTLWANDRSQLTVETPGNVVDASTASKKMEWRSVPGTTGYTLASPNKQEDININNAGEQERFNSGCKETSVEGETLDDLKQCHIETIHTNGLLQQNSRVKTQQTLGVLADPSDSECGRELRELYRTTGHDWMEDISRKLLDFKISSVRKASKVDGSAKRPKHDDNVNNDIVMGKENTPAVRKECSYKPHADGSVRRPLQNVNHN